MESIILKKGPFNTYTPEKYVNIPLYDLASFLITDGMPNAECKSNFWIDFLKGHRSGRTEGNEMELFKKNNKIYVASQFRDNSDDYSGAFSTSAENLINILISWADMLRSKPLPDEIIITQEESCIFIEPKYNSAALDPVAAISFKR